MLEAQPTFVHSQDIRKTLKKIEVKHSRVDEIADELGQTVFGQDRAIRAVAHRISLIEAGLVPSDKPLGGMLFLGPTGVGKTEMVSSIAKFWFGDETRQRLLKINGGEYSEEHEIAKFIGSPNGYVGENSPITIQHSFLARGRTIINFDEVEKMHPNVFGKIFLPILDDATLMARKGREGAAPLYFQNTLLVATSNLGSKEIAEISSEKSFGFNKETSLNKKRDVEAVAKKALKEHFEPEVINRFTDIIVFDPLRKDGGIYEHIFNKLMDERRHAMALSLKTHTPALHIADDVRDKVIASLDTTYAARDLGREIDKQILRGFSDIINTLAVGRMQIWACLDENEEIGFYSSRLPRERKRPTPQIPMESGTEIVLVPKQEVPPQPVA